ncbi:MAG: tetratricopeptide repeat protein [Anaerolineales bacterium]|nr:tetratricopeptide repeat protein [Anaerolineales bacterium]
MKKFVFLSLLIVNSLACATLERTFGAGETPTAIIFSTPVSLATSTPLAATRKETSDVYCSSDVPDAVSAYNQGVTYESAGNVNAAIAAYRQAIELDPTYCDAMDNLALLLRQTDQVQEAIIWYQASIVIAPENEVSHLGLANTYMTLEQYDNALEEYNYLLKLDVNNPEGYYGAGRVYFAEENYKEAVVQFQKAEELYLATGSAYLVDAQTYSGFSYVLMQDYENGRDYLEKVYPQMQDNAYVNYYLGQCYYYGKSIYNEALAKQYLIRARDLGITLEPELEKFVNTP